MSKPKQIAQRCKDLAYTSCALTDHGSVSGAVSFVEACKKKDILPILGLEAYISTGLATDKSKENKKLLHQIILAKNLEGWHKLIQIVSESNNEENFYYHPRIDLNIVEELCDFNFVSFSGHPGSILYDIVFKGNEPDPYIHKMWDIFGKENFFIEIQLVDERSEVPIVMNKLREVGNRFNIKCIATCDAHYATPDQVDDHRVLLCSSIQTTLKYVQTKIENGEAIGLGGFFRSNRFHIPTVSELLEYGNTAEEIENTQIITEMCEDYNIFHKPRLPEYRWTTGRTETEYFKELCREGWRKRNINEKDNKEEYTKRIQNELEVIHNASLEGYFLIVQDYVNHAKNQGILVGPARGSAAGSLVAYLLNITCVDPIKYDLIFERFYNAARGESLPDIDVDFPIYQRENIIKYIEGKYGEDKVAQMITFGRLMGRGALKETLRVHSACDFPTMNEITKTLPQEQEIADQLEATGETSIIEWTLKYEPKLISNYCTMQDGKYQGEYATYFEQASRLEGTYKSSGKHPAGLVISNQPLNTICPLLRSKNEKKIVGFDMRDSEKIGLPKWDILGVALLDKLMGVNNLLQYGKIDV